MSPTARGSLPSAEPAPVPPGASPLGFPTARPWAHPSHVLGCPSPCWPNIAACDRSPCLF